MFPKPEWLEGTIAPSQAKATLQFTSTLKSQTSHPKEFAFTKLTGVMVWGNPLSLACGRAGSGGTATPADKYLGRKLKVCLRGKDFGKNQIRQGEQARNQLEKSNSRKNR